MRRLLLPLLILGAFVGLLGVSFAAGNTRHATAAAPTWTDGLPAVTCNFTVLNFNLSGSGTVDATRPFSVTAGDTFEQFILPPITTTVTSTAQVLLNSGFAGSVTGGITGTFALTSLNGLLITSPEGISTPRGFEVHNIVINGAGGTITAALAINFAALSTSPPFLPRAFNGYLHSIGTTGAYAAYRYNGTIAGLMFPVGGNVGINATVVGRLYTGGGTLSEFISSARTVPGIRGLTLQPTDVIAQFTRPDFAVGATAPGHVDPRTTFVGTILGTINGGFVMDHNSLIADGGTNANKGWLAGEFTFSDTGGKILTGPWLTDRNNFQVNGYVWQVIGTGIYSDSLLFGTISAGIFEAGTILTGQVNGVYCEGSQIPTPTVTSTAATTTTPTPTATIAATFSPTPITPPTNTPTGVSTGTDTPTATQTATPGTTTTATATPCAMPFTDVFPTDYFYEAVRYLYCEGAISGYDDGTFRPSNLTTRGQLTKIVVLAEGWAIYTPPTPTFQDVPTGHAFYQYIETAVYHDIISGYTCGLNCVEFRPSNNITRGQLCKIIVLAEGWALYAPPTPTFIDVPASNTFYAHIETAYSHNIISGYTCGPTCLEFRPDNSATRGQICKIVYNAVAAP